MRFRLTGAEYWVLDLAVSTRHQLAWLDPEKDIETMYDRPSYGLDRRALVTTLEDLFRAGLIECVGPDETPAGPITRDFLRSALDDARWIYGLTANGGEAWESFSRPGWSRFIDERWELDTESWVVACGRRDWLQRYLSFVAIAGELPDHDPPEIREVKPREATYWKTLPNGWMVEVRRPNPLDPRPWVSHEKNLRDHLLFRGLCHRRDGWHRWR